MKLSPLKETQVQNDTVSVFGGYNHNIGAGEGEFYEMKNCTSSNYPVLSPRTKRTTYKNTTKANGMLAKDVFCYVDGASLYINDTVVSGITLTDSKKQMVSMGSYVIIMPDKVYVNTIDTTDYGYLENTVTTSGTVTYSMSNVSGEAYTITTISDTPPEEPANMELWVDTSNTPHVLMQWSELQEMWVSIATSYIRIACKNIAKGFSKGDAVRISGIDSTLLQLKDLNNKTSVLWDVYRDEAGNGTNDYIVVIGMLDTVSTQTNALTVKREMPIMDFVIESGNRLWGCRYGDDRDGNKVNEIYASKLGDFKNFNYFVGSAADSYAVTCGNDGAFTGAITFIGYPFFFREKAIHKIYGNYPSNFQIKTTECEGVMKGAGKSVAICGDYLIYKSRSGIQAYDGSLPTDMSTALGTTQYNIGEPVAGYVNNKYYISMKSEEDNTWHLLVYDLLKKMWHKEDSLRVEEFCSYKGELYYTDYATHKINTILGTGSIALEGNVEWMAESNIIGTTRKESKYTVAFPGKKYIYQMLIRMSMDLGSEARFYIQYDSCGDWVEVASITGTTLESFYVPIRPRRCDHFRLRIVGVGDCKVYSYTKYIERGSEYR